MYIQTSNWSYELVSQFYLLHFFYTLFIMPLLLSMAYMTTPFQLLSRFTKGKLVAQFNIQFNYNGSISICNKNGLRTEVYQTLRKIWENSIKLHTTNQIWILCMLFMCVGLSFVKLHFMYLWMDTSLVRIKLKAERDENM